ncbi:hydrogenase formation protein HypD [Azospirillum sp. Sh1]|uniref:hydrogenase formation protein HypD n=1 Tax=Azospirillum sp. Sh1 TaxID=2607285 RepID=UPI0011ECD38D|nr:hydrogenase formation protein HypD [Azospirillum sp. Sh1]KAA0570664.1 hydrogenase formation protein HypD [Azospirillum sp. Sh1]
MKYVDEFRDPVLARNVAAAIAREVRSDRSYHLMEFCGGHTHAISRYGIPDLLPDNVRMIHGPGCPVCVLPVGRIDDAIALARRPEVTLCTYGDVMRVPGSGRLSLLKAKAQGADVRMVVSADAAVRIAAENPDRQVVFFAIGFETTTPPTALAVRAAAAQGLSNFSVFCNHVLTPSAIQGIMAGANEGLSLDGFVGPAHVSVVIGSDSYAPAATDYGKPVVISGFEPLDVLQSILMLVRQINDGRAEVENQYTRAVTADGNRKAQALVLEIFETRPSFEWRGLGSIPHSGLKLREAYAAFDAERRFPIAGASVPDHKGCDCGAILRGVKRPIDCKLFDTVCTPENPMGSCMVSAEGACAAHYTYGRFRDA